MQRFLPPSVDQMIGFIDDHEPYMTSLYEKYQSGGQLDLSSHIPLLITQRLQERVCKGFRRWGRTERRVQYRHLGEFFMFNGRMLVRIHREQS
ncbi:hypothetical protein WT75_22240 [Burkholderia stagnalis]|nr:hypothetical protein WT75_22240 [Burkholderia stagnalis]KWN16386.1 hypothetical protein WT84_20210 [Burkholderia stagnalis]KWN35618.1 hypothetical protein WT85_08260 [Burkholderia stagnalis]